MTKTDAPDSPGPGTSNGKSPAEITTSPGSCWASVQEVINAIPQYVLLIDEGHRIFLANTAVQDALGVDPAWILGQYCPRVIHGTENPFPGCPLEESVLAGGIVLEKKLYDDARGRWLLTGVYPTGLRTAKGRRVFLHLVRDITEEERAAGEQAVEVAARLDGPIALLLTDVVMPGMSGRQVALEIAKSRPGIRTLYMTGYPDETIAPHGVLDPALPILRKPFSPTELFGKVAEVLAGGGSKG